jgi:radical SAM family RiPP maturation amino acid epimerase
MELCYADPKYMKNFLNNPEKALIEAGLTLDVNIAKEAIEIILHGSDSGVTDSNYYINLTDQIIKRVHTAISDRTRMDSFVNQEFKAWYLRQKNRVLFNSSILRKKIQVFYTPISFELTTGCSGSCSFCCLAPQNLDGYFNYSNENAILWKNVLLATKEIIGKVSGNGICYFATEPFDNPDYEKFISDYCQVFGYYPQTTTVKAVENIDRTKAFLRILGEEHLRYASVRFSVISKRQLERIHQVFTPEELSCVELLLNNPESLNGYSLSGRAFDLQKILPEKNFVSDVTSICTIGFVVNMLQRSVMLVTPKNPDNSNTVGMRVYGKVFFTDEVSYSDAIYKLISKWMKSKIPLNEKICVDIKYIRKENYLVIKGDKIHRTIGMSEASYQSFIKVLEGSTLNEAFQELHTTEFERQRAIWLMQILYDNGYIDFA